MFSWQWAWKCFKDIRVNTNVVYGLQGAKQRVFVHWQKLLKDLNTDYDHTHNLLLFYLFTYTPNAVFKNPCNTSLFWNWAISSSSIMCKPSDLCQDWNIMILCNFFFHSRKQFKLIHSSIKRTRKLCDGCFQHNYFPYHIQIFVTNELLEGGPARKISGTVLIFSCTYSLCAPIQ